MEVRDGDRYWGRGDIKREEEEVGEVEDEGQWRRVTGWEGLRVRFWE